jgi:heme/copper-type cytochrome/quinol oxidase subunit 2
MAESKTNLELAESWDAMDLVPNWELEWWWIAIAVFALILLILLVFFMFRKTKVFDSTKAKREAYQEALTELEKLDESLGKDNVIMVSLVIRKYLAKSMNEPALYETHEEFVGRHDAIQDLDEELKVKIANYFSELAAMKYGPVEEQVLDLTTIKQKAVNLLERVYNS